MPENKSPNFPKNLSSLIEIIDINAVLTDPLTASIDNLLRVSAAEMKSDEASVLIRDGDQGDLRFLTAIGKVAETLIDLKIPAGRGIAGFVFSSGQPMAISDVGAEDSFYREVDQRTGYSTQLILATPLRYNDRIIGVLEYINRRGAEPFESFTPEEMDRAAFFADTVAPLVNACESAAVFNEFGKQFLNRGESENYIEVRKWLTDLRSAAEHRETLDLAILLREVSSRGEAEKQLCREILEMILRFSDKKSGADLFSF